METEIIKSPKGDLSKSSLSANEEIITTTDFLSVLMSSPTDTVILNKDDLPEDFFDLKTGLAGEFLQKVSNYMKRLIILGDFQNNNSKSLNDFIYESNKNGRVIFTDTIGSAITLLK